MPRQAKEENLRLRSVLDEAAMSNKGLARRVVDLAVIQGVTNVRCDHTSVLRWLAANSRAHLFPNWSPRFSAMLSAGRSRKPSSA